MHKERQHCLLWLPSNPISAGILKYHPIPQSMFLHAAQNKPFLSQLQLAEDQADLPPVWTLVKTNEFEDSARRGLSCFTNSDSSFLLRPTSLLTLGIMRPLQTHTHRIPRNDDARWSHKNHFPLSTTSLSRWFFLFVIFLHLSYHSD